MRKEQNSLNHKVVWAKPVFAAGRSSKFLQTKKLVRIKLAGGNVWQKDEAGWQFFNESGANDDKFAAYGPALHVRVDLYGNATVLFKNHARVVMREDRSVLFFDNERRLKAVQFPDGTVRQQVWDGETLIAWKGPDGKLWQRCCVYTPEGKLYLDKWTLSSVKQNHSGSRSFWSGKVEVDPVSGMLTLTSIRNLSFETRTRWYSDGFRETTYQDGRRALTYLNGDSIVCNPDGSVGPGSSCKPIHPNELN